MDEPYDYTVARNRYGDICVPLSSSYTYTSRAILAGRVHEPETIDYIVAHHRGGDVIHSGAGFGDFLPGLSKGCTGTIWAFEPNDENFHCAQRTIELNGLGNVKLARLALGDAAATAYLAVMDNGVALGPRSEICDRPGDASQPCQVETLDRLFPDANVSIIHLDTEGYEFRILDGARRLIAACKPLIILEIDGRALTYNDYMRSIGYRPSEQLIYNAGEMVFVNTVYAPD
jgi:FkbM family methyltransferase